jgi:hypothetical protein
MKEEKMNPSVVVKEEHKDLQGSVKENTDAQISTEICGL